MPGIHHAAIVTADVDISMRFWRDGLGLTELFDYTFTGDWPTLFDAATDQLRSIFLGDPATPETGIVELVVLERTLPAPATPDAPTYGFFLLSLQRDVDTSMRFWRDGMGLTELFDYTFTGDWPTLFDAATDQLRSIFLGDPATPETGIVELVVLEQTRPAPATPAAPTYGFFLLSLQRDVDAILASLAGLGFADGVRRIDMPAPGGKTVAMAVITAPDGVRVELIGPPEMTPEGERE